MVKGSQPTDGGNFLFKEDEMREFIDKEPLSGIGPKKLEKYG